MIASSNIPVSNAYSNNQPEIGTPVDVLTKSTPKLFTPIQSRSVTLHSRIVVSPMCMYSAIDGMANDFHQSHYGSFALRGPGLIFMEATAVEARGRSTDRDLGIWSDAHIAP
ncbi:hypothetical protein BD560DRAFT_45995, partial [Blakeslea trispora]